MLDIGVYDNREVDDFLVFAQPCDLEHDGDRLLARGADIERNTRHLEPCGVHLQNIPAAREARQPAGWSVGQSTGQPSTGTAVTTTLFS